MTDRLIPGQNGMYRTLRVEHNYQQGAYLLADKFLPHEFSGLKHVGNVIKWAETLVLVLDLFLKEHEEKAKLMITGKAYLQGKNIQSSDTIGHN